MKMKRRILIGALAVLAVTMFSNCDNGGSNDNGKNDNTFSKNVAVEYRGEYRLEDYEDWVGTPTGAIGYIISENTFCRYEDTQIDGEVQRDLGPEKVKAFTEEENSIVYLKTVGHNNGPDYIWGHFEEGGNKFIFGNATAEPFFKYIE
jgi:hypothetical protein